MTKKSTTQFLTAIITAAIEATQDAETMYKRGLWTIDEKDRQTAEIIETTAKLIQAL